VTFCDAVKLTVLPQASTIKGAAMLNPALVPHVEGQLGMFRVNDAMPVLMPVLAV
jgi:hypothetical protein